MPPMLRLLPRLHRRVGRTWRLLNDGGLLLRNGVDGVLDRAGFSGCAGFAGDAAAGAVGGGAAVERQGATVLGLGSGYGACG